MWDRAHSRRFRPRSSRSDTTPPIPRGLHLLSRGHGLRRVHFRRCHTPYTAAMPATTTTMEIVSSAGVAGAPGCGRPATSMLVVALPVSYPGSETVAVITKREATATSPVNVVANPPLAFVRPVACVTEPPRPTGPIVIVTVTPAAGAASASSITSTRTKVASPESTEEEPLNSCTRRVRIGGGAGQGPGPPAPADPALAAGAGGAPAPPLAPSRAAVLA